MTPEEKAENLIKTFQGIDDLIDLGGMDYNCAKQCALICCDEVMQELSGMPYGIEYLSRIDYWEGVKTEIEKQ